MQNNLTAEDVQKVVTWMVEEIGCTVAIPGPTGWLDLSGHINGFQCAPQVLVEIFNDKDSVFAQLYGVEKDLYVRWNNSWDNADMGQCKGITKKGRRCLNTLVQFCPHPKDLEELSDWYCPVHESQRVVKRA
jgi:hypothetical protein